MTATSDELLIRLEKLQRQVDQLQIAMAESRMRCRIAWWGLVLLTLLAVTTGGLWMPSSQAQQGPAPGPDRQADNKKTAGAAGKDLVVSSLKIVGPDGKERLILGSDGGGYVKVFGADARLRATVGVTKDGKLGMVSLRHADGNNRAVLHGNDHGGVLDLAGNNKIIQVALNCDNQWGGRLRLRTPKTVNLLYLGANTNNGHGLFQLFDMQDQLRVEMGVDNAGVGYVSGLKGNGQVVRSLK